MMQEELEILRQLVINTEPTPLNLWHILVPPGSALIGAFLGAFFVYRSSVKQISATVQIEEKKLRANLVTEERKRWLNDLRELSSEFYANLESNYNLLRRVPKAGASTSYQQIFDEAARLVMLQSNMIVVLLNPNKKHQGAMREKSNEAIEIFNDCVTNWNAGGSNFYPAEYAKVKVEFFSALTEIGIETWPQIKELD